MFQYKVSFPDYEGAETTVFADSEESAQAVVRADVERRLGLWPRKVEVTFIREAGES